MTEFKKRGALFVGCAGFQYPHWRSGAWYPKGLRQDQELRYYSKCFRACEVNTSFYGTPSSHTVQSWLDSVKTTVPPFLVSLKMRKTITHEEGCLSTEMIERDLPSFIERGRMLGDHLGPTLIQFPPYFHRKPATVGALEALVSQLPDLFRCAVEFRHASWYCQETYKFFSEHNLALVHHPLPEIPSPPEEVTTDFMYIRLHGQRVEHEWDYTDEELAPYVEKIIDWRNRGIDVFVFFLNDADGHAPKNAFSLCSKVRVAMGEKAPKLPDDNKISNYFASTTPSISSHPADEETGTPSKKPRTTEDGPQPSNSQPLPVKTAPPRPAGGSAPGSGSGGGAKKRAAESDPKQPALTTFFKRKDK